MSKTTQQRSTRFWQEQAHEFGPQIMDSGLTSASDWETQLESGRLDLAQCLDITGMKTGPELCVLEIGCGMGRVSAALGEKFGQVLGIDVSEKLLAIAVGHSSLQNVGFELSDGEHLRPQSLSRFHTIFSYEVFHYPAWNTLKNYFQDAFTLLNPLGELVFQYNSERIRWRTRFSEKARRVLRSLGVKHWRGWPTDRGFFRQYHPVKKVQSLLDQCGFQSIQVWEETPGQTWIKAVKPV